MPLYVELENNLIWHHVFFCLFDQHLQEDLIYESDDMNADDKVHGTATAH